LREEKTTSKKLRGEGRKSAGSTTGRLVEPARRLPLPRRRAGEARGRAGDTAEKVRNAATPDVSKHEGIRPVLSTSAKTHRRASRSPALVVPLAPPPPAPSNEPSAAPKPTRLEVGADRSGTPESKTAPGSRRVEIEIRDGELRADLDRVEPGGGYLILHVRSDELVIVEIEDDGLSRPILASGEALITLEARSKGHLELKLVHRKGVLVLRVDG
jgi:hypothetical protein